MAMPAQKTVGDEANTSGTGKKHTGHVGFHSPGHKLTLHNYQGLQILQHVVSTNAALNHLCFHTYVTTPTRAR